MITACQLCAKITVENALREEATRIIKMQTAKAFAEEVISPILEKLTEIPDHLLIGYRYHDFSFSQGLYQRFSNWSTSKTARGYTKKERYLTDELKGESDYSLLDYEVLNQYLAEFGFQISWEREWVYTTTYTSTTRDTGHYLDKIFLSMTCPMEEM